jgi:transcriptional regulator of aromatic amino acid metabolism
MFCASLIRYQLDKSRGEAWVFESGSRMRSGIKLILLDKPARFALAEGGTLFPDQIGDISPAMQVI